MIKPFENILVATDFSDPACRAVERAIDLAGRYEAPLHIVHAWEFPLLGGGALVDPSPDWVPVVEESARAQLAELVDGLRGSKLEVTSTLVQGVPWDRILAVAQERSADLLVIGTHGRTGIKRALLGSVAERVVRHASMPVLTIH